MKMNITGHGLDVTEALKQFVEDKLGRLQNHFDQITSVNVILTVEKLRQIAEANVHVKLAEIHASSESENMYASIDGLVDKLDRQIIKHKEKLQNHRD